MALASASIEGILGSHGEGGTAVTGVVGIGIAVTGVFGEISDSQNPPSAKEFLTGPAVADLGVPGPEDKISHRGRGVVGLAVSKRGRCAGRRGCAPVGAVHEDEL